MTPAKIEKTSRILAGKKEFAAWIDKTRDGFTLKEVLKEFTNSSALHHRVRSIIDSAAGLSRGWDFRRFRCLGLAIHRLTSPMVSVMEYPSGKAPHLTVKIKGAEGCQSPFALVENRLKSTYWHFARAVQL